MDMVEGTHLACACIDHDGRLLVLHSHCYNLASLGLGWIALKPQLMPLKLVAPPPSLTCLRPTVLETMSHAAHQALQS